MAQRITEQEVAADLAADLDRVIGQGGTSFDRATVERSADGLRPDIVVWESFSAKTAFAFFELKRPGKQEDLGKLPEKAQSLGARYLIVWNFQNGELYEMVEGRLEHRKSYPTPFLTSLEEWAIPSKRSAVLAQARKMLADLDRLARGESLIPFVPDKFYFIGILQTAVAELCPVLHQQLLKKMTDRATRDEIRAWAVKQGYPVALPDLEHLLARQWAYSTAVRLLFYFTVRRHYAGLPELALGSDTGRPVTALIEEAFAKAQAVDWQAVFERSPLDRLGLPSEAEPIVRKLLGGLRRYDFAQLKEDVIGQILEGLIPEEERHALGQYFTREDLVDLIIGFVADSAEAAYLDPTCGSGTFLNRLYSRLTCLSGYRRTHRQLLELLWGVDIAHFPAELATVNLFRKDVRDIANFPRVVVQDFFHVRPGQTFPFPPPKAPAVGYPKVEVRVPRFRGIVGNFPYIRQELIERQNRGYKRAIVQSIASEWFWRDRTIFKLTGIRDVDLEEVLRKDQQQRERKLENWVRSGQVDLHLSGQADIYAYLFFHAAAFLEERGRLGVVTSNSWLDVDYGHELKRFLLRHFKIIAVVGSWAEPWFDDSDVNTVFTILERCTDPEERARSAVCFVKVLKPLEKLLPRDLQLQEAQRWQAVDSLVQRIETAHARIGTCNPAAGEMEPITGTHTLESDDLQIRLVPQGDLERELAEASQKKGEVSKWGRYIRAPKVYFDVLRQAQSKCVPLAAVADVRYGLKVGLSDFFYLKRTGEGSRPGTIAVRNSRGWTGEIEADLLRPALLSLKEVKGLALTGDEPKALLFLCPHTRAELQARGYRGALEYIRWGEQQRTTGRGRVGTRGVPFPEVPTVRSHRPEWFNLPDREPGQVISNSFVGERFGFPVNRGILLSNTFFEISFHKHTELYAALLNSTITFLHAELTGRHTWTQGVLYVYGPELKALPIPNARRISAAHRKRIVEAFSDVLQRPVRPIAQEVKQKDRRRLDAAVLESLGLDPGACQDLVYEGLVQLTKERLALPKMRVTRKKGERRLSVEQVKAHVQQEVLSEGVRPISAFVPPGRTQAMVSIAVTGRPVSWQSFLSEFTLLDADGNAVGSLTGSEIEARYAVYAVRAGEHVVDVPTDPIVTRQAVQRYEQYLRQLGEEVFTRAMEATRDHRQAEQITKELLEAQGLPPLAISKALGD
ncbi:N-6 DNA methylase [Candidatus Bipolaricaulota bacterium]|nr:N-6 DNA methylase [Candidatus Bipolaricaulota bacterium]